jgi:hypothetical protein
MTENEEMTKYVVAFTTLRSAILHRGTGHEYRRLRDSHPDDLTTWVLLIRGTLQREEDFIKRTFIK